MSNHSSQKTINLHHSQVENARIRKLKREYEREHRKELHWHEMKKLAFGFEVVKGLIVASVMTSLIASVIYCLYSLFG